MKKIIETDNLILREFCKKDVVKVFFVSQEEGMKKWIPDQVYEDIEEATEVVEFLISMYDKRDEFGKVPYVIGVVLKETEELIGHVGLSPLGDDIEIGYAIENNEQKKGYALEAVVGMTQWALRNKKVSSFLGVVDSDSIGSRKVLEKAGYKFVKEEEKEAFGRIGLCRVYKIVR